MQPGNVVILVTDGGYSECWAGNKGRIIRYQMSGENKAEGYWVDVDNTGAKFFYPEEIQLLETTAQKMIKDWMQ